MNATLLAIRAITSEYAKQLLIPILWIGLGIYALVIALVVWIATAVSPWWSLLGIVPTLLIIVGLLLWVIVWSLARQLSPPLSKRQRTATKKFVTHIGRVAEHVGTPKFVLVFRVIKDVVFPPQTSRTFIGEISQTPGEMKRDFEKLRDLFL